MRIGFDVSQTGDAKAGCGYFADSLLRRLAEIDGENTYLLYPAVGNGFWDSHYRRTTLQIPRSNFSRRLDALTFAESAELWVHPPPGFEARLGDPDLIHANNYFCPRGLLRARVVYTLYDLVAADHPEYITEENRLTCFNGLLDASLHADMLVAISEHSRSRFLAVFPHYPADRVKVVYPGSRFLGARSEGRAVDGLAPDGFWLSVGTLEPRKNLRRLLRAFARLRSETGESRPLVVAGGAGWKEEGLESFVAELGVRDAVRFLGYVDDPELKWLYGNCFGFVYPSLVEGFGLPVAEAMSLGAAVVTSNASSLPEVAGDAALAVPPEEEGAIAAAMGRLACDPALRDRLRASARQRAALFSWDKAARDVLAVYEEVMGRERRWA